MSSEDIPPPSTERRREPHQRKNLLVAVFADAAPLDLRIVGRTLLHATAVGLGAGAMACVLFFSLELLEQIFVDAGLALHRRQLGPSRFRDRIAFEADGHERSGLDVDHHVHERRAGARRSAHDDASLVVALLAESGGHRIATALERRAVDVVAGREVELAQDGRRRVVRMAGYFERADPRPRLRGEPEALVAGRADGRDAVRADG